jgi:UDP-N-acetylmuramyl-tripeptide synthetase
MALACYHQPEAAAQFLHARGCAALRTDSRRVQPGDGFLAWPGRSHDARGHVASALAAGARACVVEADGAEAFGFEGDAVVAYAGLKADAGPLASAFFDHPSHRLDIVASTGTNGKTSTAWWTAQALTALQQRSAIVGTLGVGEPGRTLASSSLTTPDAVDLQSALAGFVQQGFKACAIEASSVGLVEHRLAGLQIAVALFTNLTQDHLDYHGDMAAYGEAKRRLFDWPGLRAAVINIDDAFGAALAERLPTANVTPTDGPAPALWTVSLQGSARLQAQGLRYEHGGLVFDVHEAGERTPVTVRSSAVGDYNASNLLLVVGALRALGHALPDIAAVLPALAAVPGRLQPVSAGGERAHAADAAGPAVLVDYAHTPDALDKVLQALRPMAGSRSGRLWCVFGCGGNRDAGKRPLMGAIAAARADQVVLTSDNPRHEAPEAILSQIRAGMPPDAAVTVIVDRAQAITQTIQQATADDVVLVAGKGHEDYQDVAGVRRPFLDAAVAEQALRGRALAAHALRGVSS